MARSKNLHTSPILSTAHLLLRREVVLAGFDSEHLRNFLWLINAHDRLIALPRICENVLNILRLAEETWQASINEFDLLNQSVPILNWIVQNAVSLSCDIGVEFNRQPKDSHDHPVMNRGSSRHPLYTTLWNTCESAQLKNKFTLLQAHLLFAHTKQLLLGHDRDGYENYAGQKEWKGMLNSPYAASLAIRDISELQYAETLSSLPAELDPIKFASALASIPQIESSTLLKRIKDIEVFQQKAAGLRRWIRRTSSGGQGDGGSPRITGYVELSKQIRQQEVLVGDMDDQDDSWGNLSQVMEIGLDYRQQQELLASDTLPEEFDIHELLLTGYISESHLSGGYAATGPAQARHIIMANQLFPWSFGQLTTSEVARALAECSDWVRHTFIKPSFQPKSDHIEKLEAICLIHIMLFTGSSFERARNLLVLSDTQLNESAALAFILNKSEYFTWRVRAIQPDYKTELSKGSDTERKRTDYFMLPDVAHTGIFIQLLLNAQTRQSENTEQPTTTRANRLFRHRPETLRSNFKALLSTLDSTGRLTESKLSKFLFGRLLTETRGDICAASMIAGEEHLLSHVRLFYSVIQVDYLRRCYIKATQDVVKLLQAATGKEGKTTQILAAENRDRFVGSRLCPTRVAVEMAILNLKRDVMLAKQGGDFIRHHNLYSLLMVWRFAFSTACRAIETPYQALSEIDSESGIGLISDKDDGTGYKSRLIWLPAVTMSGMVQYEKHRSALLIKHLDIKLQENLPIFFLEKNRKGKLEAVAVRPGTMQTIMEDYLSYPANFHRRFVRTELLERGCPTEVVDAWMGHWHTGEEPWAMFSSFGFQAYRDSLQLYLVPLLEKIGLGEENCTIQLDSHLALTKS